jgi:hypothetical protein
MLSFSWWLGIASGILIGSGSGLVPPFAWIERLGLPAPLHLWVGLATGCVAWLLYVFAGGPFWPFEVRRRGSGVTTNDGTGNAS